MTDVVEEHAHDILSPSGADRWMVCRGSVMLTKDLPNPDSSYATEGTDYHYLASICLEEETNAADYVGQALPSGALVTEDNAAALQKYIDLVRSLHAASGGELQIEKKVPTHKITGEPGGKGGTSDAIIIPPEDGDELIVADLKFGMGVEVHAEKNRQGMIYAIGALELYELWDLVKTVRIVISQPRLDHVSEWTCSIESLREFADEVRRAAKPIVERLLNPKLPPLPLVPDEKACRFCLNRAVLLPNGDVRLCPALEEYANKTMLDGFETIEGEKALVLDDDKKPVINVTGDKLAELMKKSYLLETFANSIYDLITAARAKVEHELQNGQEVPGWKLVEGKKGNREWSDEERVTELFKQFRLLNEEMYKQTLITPSKAEELFKKKGNPGRWKKAQKWVEQEKGKPSVVPVSDKRPALQIGKAEDGMEAITEDDDYSDLL